VKITPVDIQHREFRKALQGYAREDVDQFLDEIIESLEADIEERAKLQETIADLQEKISHFKAMESSLQNTLVLAQRTADELKASAHKEVELIKQRTRVEGDNELQEVRARIAAAKQELQQTLDHLASAKHDLRIFLSRHLALIDEARPELHASAKNRA
jgi:cell division initiation protein